MRTKSKPHLCIVVSADTAMGSLDLGRPGEEESLLLTPGDLEASVELPFQTALSCHDCVDHLSDQDDCKGNCRAPLWRNKLF